MRSEYLPDDLKRLWQELAANPVPRVGRQPSPRGKEIEG